MIAAYDWHIDPTFSKYLFWDTDTKKLDFKVNDKFVIQRAFERGTLSDLVEVLAYYGHQRVAVVLTETPYLPENVVMLAAVILKLQPSQFKCYTSKP